MSPLFWETSHSRVIHSYMRIIGNIGERRHDKSAPVWNHKPDRLCTLIKVRSARANAKLKLVYNLCCHLVWRAHWDSKDRSRRRCGCHSHSHRNEPFRFMHAMIIKAMRKQKMSLIFTLWMIPCVLLKTIKRDVTSNQSALCVKQEYPQTYCFLSGIPAYCQTCSFLTTSKKTQKPFTENSSLSAVLVFNWTLTVAEMFFKEKHPIFNSFLHSLWVKLAE